MFYLQLLLSSLLTMQPPFEEVKKFNLSVCSVFQDEPPSKEWIEYHQLIGVEHFYLYNNCSKEDVREVLKPYLEEEIVTLIDWPGIDFNEADPSIWILSTKLTAYENAIKVQTPKETRWLVFLEIDEFLLPKVSDNLLEVLEFYHQKPGIILTSDYYRALQGSNLLIHSKTLTPTPPITLDRQVLKTVFKPEECMQFTWPPYRCIFKEGNEAVELKPQDACINRYVTSDESFLDFEETTGGAIERFIPRLLKKMNRL